MRQKIFESIGIILCTTFIALLTNSFRSDGLPLIRAETSPQQLSSGTELGEGIISLKAFLKRLDQPGVIILDARDPEDYAEHRKHRPDLVAGEPLERGLEHATPPGF